MVYKFTVNAKIRRIHSLSSNSLFLFFTTTLLQYDVELYQRIEHLINKQLPLYKTEEDEVMVLQERVLEAQRIAKMVNLFLQLLLTLLNIFVWCRR